jgi:hypothetical protein
MLAVDEEAVLEVRNFDIAMWREKFARARGDVYNPAVGSLAAGIGAVCRARKVSELEGEQPQPIVRGEDPQLVLPRGRDGVAGGVEVAASDRNAWLGDTAITNEWGNSVTHSTKHSPMPVGQRCTTPRRGNVSVTRCSSSPAVRLVRQQEFGQRRHRGRRSSGTGLTTACGFLHLRSRYHGSDMGASEDGQDANAGRLSHRASVLSEGLKRHDPRMGGLTVSAITVVSLHELGRKQSIRQLLPRFTQAKYLNCLVESICQDRPDRIF